MDDVERYSMTFSCLQCQDRHTGLFLGGIPDAVECPSCGARFPLSELDGFEVTLDPELPGENRPDESGSPPDPEGAEPPPIPETGESPNEATSSKQSFEAPDSTLIELDGLVSSSSPSTQAPNEATSDPHVDEVEGDDSSLEAAATLDRDVLRDVFGRRRLYLRTATAAEIGPVDADQFVTIVQNGRLADIHALREEDEDWVELDQHPLIVELCERLAGGPRQDTTQNEEHNDTLEEMQREDAPSDESGKTLPASEASITPPSEWRDSASDSGDRTPQRASPDRRAEKVTQETERVEPDSVSSPLRTVAKVVVATALLGAGIYLFLHIRSNSSDPSAAPSSDPTAAATTSSGSDAAGDAASSRTENVAEAIRQATGRVDNALDFDPTFRERQLRVARRLADRGDHAGASHIYDALWNRRGEQNADVPEFVDSYLRSLEQSSRHERLRAILVDAFQSASEANREQYRERFHRSIENDPLLGNVEPVRLGDDLEFSAARPADESDAEGWFLLRDGTRMYLFRPESSDDSDWRDDVAAWRLCRILVCPFDIPETRAASIERSYFKDRAGSSELPSSLEWTRREDANDETHLVSGSLRDWPGNFVRWPIERTGIWRRWLERSGAETNFDAAARDSLRQNWGAAGGSMSDALGEHLVDTSVRSIARQLSAVITFDYLVNNWGRFADDERKWGSHNHFREGRFVTIWTGTVFQARKSRRVRGRFYWVDRFPRDFITAIRLLPRRATLDALYPEQTAPTERKFEVFWEQRRALLDRIDSLVGEHGTAEVLVFE